MNWIHIAQWSKTQDERHATVQGSLNIHSNSELQDSVNGEKIS
jgi:hypothetical protein